MQLTSTFNKQKKGIELHFSEVLPKELAFHLKELGFKETLSDPMKWYVDNHPAYCRYVEELEKEFVKDGDWKHVLIHPSFESSLENIDKGQFTYVTIFLKGQEKAEQENYVVFDSYKKVAHEIASRFAMRKYGDTLKHIEVHPRNYKRKSRVLFRDGKVIDGMVALESVPIQNEVVKEVAENDELVAKEGDAANDKVPKELAEEKTEIGKEPENDSGYKTDAERKLSTRSVLKEVIEKLNEQTEDLDGEPETIIATTVMDLEDAADQWSEIHFKNHLLKALQNFKDWVYDLDIKDRAMALMQVNRLNQSLSLELIPLKEVETEARSIAKDIFNRDHIVPNVLVPVHAGEPFQSGSLTIGDGNFLKFKFPQLYTVNDENLKQVSGLELFQLSQMPHPNDYGIAVNRSTLLQEWENRGPEAFATIGYPTDLNYPYVNIHTGYKSVSPLGAEIDIEDNSHKWWSVVEHSRPIANPQKGIEIIDAMLLQLVEDHLDYVNPKTGKPKTDKKSKEAFNEMQWQMNRLERSKSNIQDYLDGQQKPDNKPKSLPKKQKTQKSTTKNDYIDRVVAVMHTAFAKAERLSKKKVEALKEETGAPNLGALWEAVELSWLLWYKMLYKEPIAFESRLRKMDFFWSQVQPTYAYSDSSKELYKQYSTPCPIGAIVAEYTQMKDAEFIFEPSAGNGLLLVGANPRITHVNEIDNSRKKSLEYQGFGRITNNNAAEPFPEVMNKVHDVVVTNPPFARWEASKFDKQRIANKYFNKQRGIANHIRLEHLMAGLALHTMKGDGKAAIIIMGHVYFGEDGLFAKYRPFFNWLYRHYHVDDIINMNSYKLYNKQGAVTKTMLILVGGRKSKPSGVAPDQTKAPELNTMVETFFDLWKRVKSHIKPNLNTLISQLKKARIQ